MAQTLPTDSELEVRIPLDTDRSKVDDSVNAAPSYFRTSKGDVFEYRNCVTDDEIADTYCTVRLSTHQLGVLHGKPALRLSFKFTLHPSVPRIHRFRNALVSVHLTPTGPSGAIPEISAFSPEVCFGSPSPRRKSFHQMAFDVVSHTWKKGGERRGSVGAKGGVSEEGHEDHFSISGRGEGEPVHTIVWEMTEDRESEHGCMGLPRVVETAAVISYEGPFSISFKVQADLGWEWGRREWVPHCWPLVGEEKAVEVDPEVLERNEEEFAQLLHGGLLRHTSFGEKNSMANVQVVPVN